MPCGGIGGGGGVAARRARVLAAAAGGCDRLRRLLAENSDPER